jgi:hypothetical protein
MLLTIYILSHNASTDVSRMLDSLLPWGTDDVQIIIGDNSDNNEVVELTEGRKAEFGGRLRCLKHACNIGIMGNLLRAFEVAGGRYVWIVGCGDRFMPGALAVVKAVLAERPDEFIFFPVNGLKRRPWPSAGTYKEFAIALADLELGPLASINSTIYQVNCARRYLNTAYWSASSLIPQTAMIAAGLADGRSLYFHPVQVFERLPRPARRWDPRTFWVNLSCVYPLVEDWPKWIAIRSMILKNYENWIVAIPKEGYHITSPVVSATLRQFGLQAFPLTIRLCVKMCMGKLESLSRRDNAKQADRRRVCN